MNWQPLFYGIYYTAIEHAFLNGRDAYHAITLKAAKKELSLFQKKSFASFDECSNNISTKQPVLLVVNNQEVLSKATDQPFENHIEAAKFCFPDLTIQHFYIEMIANNRLSIVSICRKETIEKILSNYEKKGIQIAGFSLGNNPLNHNTSFFKKTHFYTSNAAIDLDESKNIQSITWLQKDTSKNYQLNGLEISNHNLLAFSAILNFYTQQKNSSPNFLDRNHELLRNFSIKKSYYHGLCIGPGIILILLLLNTGFFFKYQQKISIFKEQLQFHKIHEDKRAALQIEIEQQKGLANAIAAHSGSSVSWHLDALGIGIPQTILLSTLQYQPLLKKMKKGKQIVFNARKIIIQGTASNDKDFTEWLKNLETKAWVQSCTILDYGRGKKAKTSFTIQLTL
jgi:hypothetical protein